MPATNVLSEILRTVTVQGSLYFRTAFRPPWGVVVPRFSNVARFHLLTRGACWVRVENCSQPIRLESRDLIVIPHGSEHHLLDDLNTPPLAVDEVVRQAGFKGEGALVYGAESAAEPTSMVCGHFTFDADRGRLLLQSLPGLIHIPHTETLNYGWLDDAMKFIAYEAAADQPGAIAIVNRLSEIILIQTLRRLAIAYKPERGLFAALAKCPGYFSGGYPHLEERRRRRRTGAVRYPSLRLPWKSCGSTDGASLSFGWHLGTANRFRNAGL